MNMGKRVVSLLLVLVLALGIMPMSNAKADDPIQMDSNVTFKLNATLPTKAGESFPATANISYITTTGSAITTSAAISSIIVTTGGAATVSIVWSERIGETLHITKDKTTKAGKTYCGIITLKAQDGYAFTSDIKNLPKVMFNSDKVDASTHDKGLRIAIEFKIPSQESKKIEEVKLDVPSKLEAGMTVKEAFDLFKVGDGEEGYELSYVDIWPHDLNGNEIEEDGDLLYNDRIYRFTLMIYPEEEYYFEALGPSGAPFGGDKYLGKVSSAITPYGIGYINDPINSSFKPYLMVGYEYKIGGSKPNYYYPTYYAPTTKAPANTNTETISVTGNESASISVKVENGNAILGEFTDAVINAADGKSDADTNIVVNLSSKSNVTSATLTKASVNKIASAINDDTNSIKGLEVNFAGGTAEFDAQAVNSINNQAAGDVTISITQIAITTLSGAQQTAVSGMNVTTVVKSTVTSNGQTISNFGSGMQTISVNVSLTGRNGNFFHAFYVASNGTMTAQKTYFANGKVNFLTNHNSEFVIVYDETTENNPLLDVYRLYNATSGDHLLTTNKAEYETLVKYGWNDEGVAFKATAMNGTKVYRLFNAKAGMHFYTANEGEKTALLNYGWKYEGSMFVSGGEKNVYRVYNTTNALSAHIFTANEGEYKTLVANGWRDEGVAFKAN